MSVLFSAVFAEIEAAMNYYLTFVLLVSAASQISAGPPPPLNLTVFFESYDTPSFMFFKKQLAYTEVIIKYKFNVEPIPFGFATLKENPWSMTCKKGPRQCFANTDLACAYTRIRPENYVSFTDCILESALPDEALEKCAEIYHEKYEPIEECAIGEEGKRLMVQNARRTQSFIPRIDHLPFLVINGKYNPEDEKAALESFPKYFCSTFPADDLPKGCEKYRSVEGEQQIKGESQE